MNKLWVILILCGATGWVWCDSPAVDILKFENEILPNNGYQFSYETIDGQKRFENGGFNENGVWVVRGGYSYIGDDGVEYAVTYVADEQGYRAEGEHLPQQPDSQSGGGLPLSFLKF